MNRRRFLQNGAAASMTAGLAAGVPALAADGAAGGDAAPADAAVHGFNVKAFGAVGDGVADDTHAIQRAIDAARNPNLSSEVFVPTGTYRVTETLVFDRIKSFLFRGQGSSALGPRPGGTTLVWDGPAGGSLMRSVGIGGFVFRDFNLSGRPEGKAREDGQAGILYETQSVQGWGNMINKMSGVCFYHADTGIAMNTGGIDLCNSDMHFEFCTFRGLDVGFQVRRSQGVNFLFTFLFGLSCGKVLDFQQGGNLLVNNAQLTRCGVFLDIGGGGRNVGTYNALNVRVESSVGGRSDRMQLLRCYPKYNQANVRFAGFNDCQWDWRNNRTPSRETPLCDIGPGSVVVLDSSLFNGPVATLTGAENLPASLIVREGSFSYLDPSNAVRANAHGYFKLIHPFTDKMVHRPDVVKWPAHAPIEIGAGDYAPQWD